MRKAVRQQPKASGITFGERGVNPGIAFAAADVVAGITFHLLDEGIAGRVCGESAERAVRRMATAAGAMPAEISRSLWQEMTNGERLEWLLESSGTSYEVDGDGVARLGVRGR